MRNLEKGFTLLEIISIVLIIFVVLLMILYAVSRARAEARDEQRMTDVEQILKALQEFYRSQNEYPSNLNELAGLYISRIPAAPTPPDGQCKNAQNSYQYIPMREENTFELYYCLSSGAHIASPEGIR